MKAASQMNMLRYLLVCSFVAILSLQICAFGAEQKADNSAKNVRDRDGKTKTPADQSDTPEDRKMTQQIRQAVMGDKGLSMTAKNIKIITVNGEVTLRGTVKHESEKSRIDKLAKAAAGEKKVINQLEAQK
jgi:osmotically-inducible protein OsmY